MFHKINRFDLSIVIFYISLTLCVLGLSFAFGLYSGVKKNVFWEFAYDLNTLIDEASTLTKTYPKHFLQPAHYEGNGVTKNNVAKDKKLVLLSGFFDKSNELRLIKRDGTIIARWPVSFSKIFPDSSHLSHRPATDWNVDTHGALILPDGSVVFNIEHVGLVKLDRCGNVVWKLARITHHSVEQAEKGGFWVPGRRYHSKGNISPFPPFNPPFGEDTIIKVSENGEILKEISVPKLFYTNGLEAVLTANGEPFYTNLSWDHEIVHLNKIAELSSTIANDFPMFKAGDLVLSMRKLNLLMVIDPDTSKVKWWKTGPWLRQHDPEFKRGGTITVFNNNTYRTSFEAGADITNINMPHISNIIEINPVTNIYKIIYGGKKGQEMLSIIRGKHDLTENGGLFITEFEGGRVFETDASGKIIWEYINRYNSNMVAEITEARLYDQNYFKVSDWSCK